MNATIAAITFRGMLGRRRALLLVILPVILLALAGGFRASGNGDVGTAAQLLEQFAIGALLPLLALIAGTGVIGPEIDDGQIMYILTKPIARPVISTTKLAVAVTLVIAFGVVPILATGLIMSGTAAQLAVAFTVGALLGGVAYCVIFVALAVLSRHAVTIGLLYALVWENLIGQFAPGAKVLSVRQWSLAITDALTDAPSVDADTGLGTAVPLLVIVVAAGTVLAGRRLRTLTVTSAE